MKDKNETTKALVLAAILVLSFLWLLSGVFKFIYASNMFNIVQEMIGFIYFVFILLLIFFNSRRKKQGD